MKQCTYCGKECDDTATACPIDGKSLAAITPQPLLPLRQHDRSEALSAQPQGLFFPQQIGRVSFIARYVLSMLAAGLGSFLLVLGDNMEPGVQSLAVLACSAVVLLVAWLYFVRHVLVARLRDMGIHPRFALLIFFPIVNAVFMDIVILFASLVCLVFLAITPRGGFKKQSMPNVG